MSAIRVMCLVFGILSVVEAGAGPGFSWLHAIVGATFLALHDSLCRLATPERVVSPTSERSTEG